MSFIKIMLFIWMHLLTGCESIHGETALKTSGLNPTVEFESEVLLDTFLVGEVSAIYDDNEEKSVWLYDWLWCDEKGHSVYSVGERIDLDNDGENEQIIHSPYGERYLDVRNGKVYVCAGSIFGTPEIDFTATSKSEELLDAFLAGEVSAIYDDNGEKSVWVYDWLWADEKGHSVYSAGERIDLDNDGENEQIINGPYGGKYLDARDGKVYVFAEGEGTSGELFFTYYDDAVWIVHCDITHAGRQRYWLTRYDGGGNVVDEFQFSAEYWDSPISRYDENSDFTFRDKKISMEEYEALGKEIFRW